MTGPATLSEHESKALLHASGLVVAAERLAADAEEAEDAAEDLGYPVVVKLCGRAIAHKTERDLVRLGLGDAASVRRAADELLAAARPEDGDVCLLVAEQVPGRRELIIGVTRNAQFGLTIMLGFGGILAEAIGDVVFRLLPITDHDARQMIAELRTQTLLGEFRGEPAVDRDALSAAISAVGAAAERVDDLESLDVNPLIVVDGIPVAVDALVVTEARR